VTRTSVAGESRRGLLVPRFRPAAAYRLEGQPLLARHLEPIRVVDADVGPIKSDAHDTEVGQSMRSKIWAPGEGRLLPETLRPGMNVIDVGLEPRQPGQHQRPGEKGGEQTGPNPTDRASVAPSTTSSSTRMARPRHPPPGRQCP
jgi:hypothetical protein